MRDLGMSTTTDADTLFKDSYLLGAMKLIFNYKNNENDRNFESMYRLVHNQQLLTISNECDKIRKIGQTLDKYKPTSEMVAAFYITSEERPSVYFMFIDKLINRRWTHASDPIVHLDRLLSSIPSSDKLGRFNLIVGIITLFNYYDRGQKMQSLVLTLPKEYALPKIKNSMG